MYFRRKIDSKLYTWLNNEDRSPALVVGIRQCGKTETIRQFVTQNGYQIVEINFWTNPDFRLDFEGKLDVDTIISNLSLRFPNIDFNPKKIILFFDEIQDCPRARLSFKNFKVDGRYIVIGSGSYLGINGYVIGDSTPTPTGYEDVFHMKTMDFEEFLWALGYKEEQINFLYERFINRNAIPLNMHNLYKDIFNKYLCIGGFPKVVKEYIKTNKIIDAFKVLNSTVFDMKIDFGRRMSNSGSPVFKAAEVSRIQNVFDLIPTFLAKKNKRFIVSKVQGGTQYDKNDAIEYLKQAHIVQKVYNVEAPSLPLQGMRIESQFKLFPEDIGIVSAMYGLDFVAAVNRGELGQGKGALYEALVFDGLSKADIEPFYFAKKSGLEIDFVISYGGYATLVEAKAKNGNTKSSKTVMSHPEHYGKTKLIKIGDYNIGGNDDMVTIPHYLVFILGKLKYDF